MIIYHDIIIIYHDIIFIFTIISGHFHFRSRRKTADAMRLCNFILWMLFHFCTVIFGFLQK